MQQDIELGRLLRDEGTKMAIQRAGADWHKSATDIALMYFAVVGDEGALFEDVRGYAQELGMPSPPSPNAWGAVCLALSKRKQIIKTGELRASRAVKSHARSQPVWRISTFD